MASDKTGSTPKAPTPDKALRIEPYTGTSAGMGALKSTMLHVSRELGLWQGAKLLLRNNQDGGFDCPGCAWPEEKPSARSAFEFCENGAKAVAAEGTRGRVDPDFFARHTIPDLLGRTDHWLEGQGRLTHPMIRRKGADRYEPIGWDQAFEHIGGILGGLDSPDEAIFYTSGRTSNEAAFLYQLFARHFGTNNMPDCSNMCHESSGRGLGATLGVGKGTVGLHDFEAADAIFIIGQNPGTNHPRMLTVLEKAARRGCKIVSVNPLRERALERFTHPQDALAMVSGGSTAISSLYLQVQINGDVALLKGIMKEVMAAEAAAPGTVLDRDFIEAHTDGFDAFEAALAKADWDTIVEQSGISREEIREAAQIYVESRATIICWAMGLTQHKNAVGNIQEVVNLLLLKGNMGRRGAGACPVRGHSNVQGDRTMGIVERPKPAFLDKISEVFGFEPPREHGFDTVEAIEAMHEGRAKVFFAMGGNFHSATPDTDFTAEALQKCRLTVQVSTKLNRSHLVTGEEALILPCLGRTERDIQAAGIQFVTVENSMSIVHRSQGRRDPASEHLLSEPVIVARLAQATLKDRSKVDWRHLTGHYDRIRNIIEKVVPGFHHYNDRVHKPGGFLLPNGARDRDFKTEVGKARFTVHDIPRHNLAEGQYLMMTIRSHDQYNTTIYGLDDRYRGIYDGRRVVMMNARDIADAKLSEGQVVTLTSHFEGERREAPGFRVVPFDLPRRCVATYFPEANVLVPVRAVADVSNTPASKSIVVSLG